MNLILSYRQTIYSKNSCKMRVTMKNMQNHQLTSIDVSSQFMILVLIQHKPGVAAVLFAGFNHQVIIHAHFERRD